MQYVKTTATHLTIVSDKHCDSSTTLLVLCTITQDNEVNDFGCDIKHDMVVCATQHADSVTDSVTGTWHSTGKYHEHIAAQITTNI